MSSKQDCPFEIDFVRINANSDVEYEASPPPENYYAREYNSDQYTPSPPHASGGSYFPQSNSFPPPPTGAAYDPNFHYEPNTHLPQDPPMPIPPYNPQDYANQQPPVMTGGAGPAPNAHPPATGHGEHVSNNSGSNGLYGLRSNPTGVNLHDVPVNGQPYYSPPSTAPVAPVVGERSVRGNERGHEEGAFQFLSSCPPLLS